jgi:hypothetical protein
MGHSTKDFKITTELEKLFNEYKTLNSKYFHDNLFYLELEIDKKSSTCFIKP